MATPRAREVPRRLRAGAGMLLAAALLAVAAPVAHQVAEARASHADHLHEGPCGFAVQEACPPGCSDQGHHHHGHDPATCASCKLLHGAVAMSARAPHLPSLEAHRPALAPLSSRTLPVALVTASPRGPPSPHVPHVA